MPLIFVQKKQNFMICIVKTIRFFRLINKIWVSDEDNSLSREEKSLQDASEETVDGKMFQGHVTSLNQLLLNHRADSGSFSFYEALETCSEYYIFKVGEGRESSDS